MNKKRGVGLGIDNNLDFSGQKGLGYDALSEPYTKGHHN